MSIIEEIENRLFGDDDEEFDLGTLSLEELEEQKAALRTDIKLKRDRHEDLNQEREQLFEKIVDTEDELLKKELAQEIASIEDKMAILHNEHTQLMDSLRVIDGLIAIKRKEQMADREGLINDIREMDKNELVETLRQTNVREMIREEKWDELESLLKGQLQPDEISNERVDEIIQQAEDVKHLQDEMGVDEAVEHALEERDKKRQSEALE